MVNPRVFLDFAVGTESIGRVVFELDNASAPKTVENFRSLCTGEKGLSAVSERPLYYKNSIIHRSIRDFMIQGGDFTKRNGTGGESIYGGVFRDEDLSRPLDSEGLLCMANKGPDSNGSQFFVTLRDCPHLNGKHVVFGKVIRGYDEVIKKIAQVPVDSKDRPEVPVVIVNCGELQLRKHMTTDQTPSTIPVENESSGRKRRDERSRSRSPNQDQAHRHRKKSKRAKNQTRDDADRTRNKTEVVGETEEEYDARLEREELLRLEEAKKKELERLKTSMETSHRSEGGVRFKGRGRMKYVDPELPHRR